MRKTSTRAIIKLYDTSALLDGEYTTNTIQDFCDIDTLNYETRRTKKYATCEEDVFLLDGNYSYFPDLLVSEDFSYWSDTMSDEDGLFTVNPKLVREFDYPHSSVGLTIGFDNSYPLPIKIKLSFYSFEEGSYVLIDSKEFVITSFNSFCEISAENYRKLEFEFMQVQPYQYARVSNIMYGRTLEYSSDKDKNVSKAEILEEIDISSNEVPISTSSLTVIDPDELFSITNPNGVYKYLQQRQVIEIYETLNDEEYQMANHYLMNWKTESGTVSTFECQDIIGLLDNSTYKGNLFFNETVENIISEILNDFSYSNYFISDDIKNIELSGAIAPCTYRQALQQVLFACNGTVDSGRDGFINFYKASESTTTTVGRDREFATPKYEITQSDLITGVRVTAHEFVKASEKSEAYKATHEAGIYYVTFSDPYDTLTATNCTILNSGYYYAEISVSSLSEVIIEGYKYEDNKAIYEKNNDTLPLGTNINIKEVENATLISKANASSVALWLYNYYQYRLTHDLKIILNNEKAGLYSAIANKDGLASAVIRSMNIDLTGGFLATVKAIGYALAITEHDNMQKVNELTDEYVLYSGDEITLM